MLSLSCALRDPVISNTEALASAIWTGGSFWHSHVIPGGSLHCQGRQAQFLSICYGCNPVSGQAIMLVESEDGQSALLGRSKTIRTKGILTCLSGFIEQGESIEEAVRREVMEEAGLPVSTVVILGSQPWPIGAPSSA